MPGGGVGSQPQRGYNNGPPPNPGGGYSGQQEGAVTTGPLRTMVAAIFVASTAAVPPTEDVRCDDTVVPAPAAVKLISFHGSNDEVFDNKENISVKQFAVASRRLCSCPRPCNPAATSRH